MSVTLEFDFWEFWNFPQRTIKEKVSMIQYLVLCLKIHQMCILNPQLTWIWELAIDIDGTPVEHCASTTVQQYNSVPARTVHKLKYAKLEYIRIACYHISVPPQNIFMISRTPYGSTSCHTKTFTVSFRQKLISFWVWSSSSMSSLKSLSYL